jgi:hypothetical protein
LRRAVWIALFGSAALGLFIMVTNIIAGDTVSINDLAIQTSALVILGFCCLKIGVKRNQISGLAFINYLLRFRP